MATQAAGSTSSATTEVAPEHLPLPLDAPDGDRSIDDSPSRTLDPEDLCAVYMLHDRRRLSGLPRASRSLACLFDGVRTVAQICADGGVSITRALRLVDRLTRLDVLVVVLREGSRGAPDPTVRLGGAPSGGAGCVPRIGGSSGFSVSDEAFFASEVKDDALE